MIQVDFPDSHLLMTKSNVNGIILSNGISGEGIQINNNSTYESTTITTMGIDLANNNGLTGSNNISNTIALRSSDTQYNPFITLKRTTNSIDDTNSISTNTISFTDISANVTTYGKTAINILNSVEINTNHIQIQNADATNITEITSNQITTSSVLCNTIYLGGITGITGKVITSINGEAVCQRHRRRWWRHG